ncbi:MAG: TIGR03087 family PEP-CTERM/XrtA system glycosyltransferase [Erythrobacter cryptus]
MGEILFLAHRVPFPPDRGDRIRSHHLLQALSRLAPVHVGCFAEGHDPAAEAALRALAASACVVRRAKPLLLAGAEAVLTGRPVSLAAFASRRLAAFVRATLAARPISAIVVFSGQMGQFVPDDYPGRVVVDLCDVDSAKFAAYAAAGERVWLNAREARLLAAEEERLGHRAHATLLISENEAALYRSRLDAPGKVNIRVIGNGIDAARFDPAAAQPHPALARAPGPHFVFTGQMDYPPNVAAVQRMAGAILPAIRARVPSARFHIVGRAPAAPVRALDGEGGVSVWGEVPDVRPFLAAADLVVAPLAIARGVQNKVLEAMAMARPVVLSGEAATGIEAEDGVHFAIGADDAALAASCLRLLADRQSADRMGLAAREHVVTRQGWSAMLAPLAGLLLGQDDRRDAA